MPRHDTLTALHAALIMTPLLRPLVSLGRLSITSRQTHGQFLADALAIRYTHITTTAGHFGMMILFDDYYNDDATTRSATARRLFGRQYYRRSRCARADTTAAT